MRILHVVNTIYQGGIRTLLLDMVKYQVKQGNEVSILCMIDEDRYFQTSEDFIRAGVNIIRGSLKKQYNPFNIFVIRKYIVNYDIVHVHQFPNQLYAKLAYNLIKRKKRPILITTEHNTYNNRRKYPLLKYLDRWFYKDYDRIVTISIPTERSLNEWLKSNRIKRSIININNGIDIDKFSKAEPARDLIELKEDRNVKLAVMVARMTHPKDPLTLVRALEFCPPNVHILFVGDGALISQIREYSKENGVENRVHILGLRNDIPQILKQCDVGVLSTQWDGFGLVAAEYMAAGLPVAVTDVEGLRDVVNDSELLFEYQDHKTLGKIIHRLLTDEKYRQSKIEHSKKQSHLFSSEDMNKRYYDTYLQLLTDRNK